MKVQEIADWFDGEVIGDASVDIVRVSKIEESEPGSLTFLANPLYERHIATTRASAVLVSRKLDLSKHKVRASLVLIRVEDPYTAFLRAIKTLNPPMDPFPSGIHATAVVSGSARLGKNVTLGAHVVIEDNASVGDNTRISHGCSVGKGAEIGSDCLLYPGVTIYHQCKVGRRVILHSGVVIGSDGFGFAPNLAGSYEKIPQMGIAVLEDDVEIGANTTVDRATLGETLIKKGVKLDNLVQIAHNVVVGENTVIAAMTGLSGSVKIGKNCRIGGQVGFNGHIEIADNVTILAQSGITKSLLEPGMTYFGTPQKPMREAYRVEAALRSLPQMAHEFAQVQRDVKELRKLASRKRQPAAKKSGSSKKKKK